MDQNGVVCVVSNTDDPILAARLSERLGPAVQLATPRVPLPANWVLRHYRDNVALASYAVRYCDDPEALSIISHREKRLAVHCALAENPHLPQEDRDRLAAQARAFNYPKLLSRATRPHPWSVFDRLDQLSLDFPRSTDLLAGWQLIDKAMVFLRVAPSSEAVNYLLELFASSNNVWVVVGFLESHFRMPRAKDHDVWDLATLSPTHVVSLMSRPSGKRVLSELAARLTSPGPGQLVPFDLDFTRLLTARVVPWHQNPDPKTTLLHSFTPDAIDELLTRPNWYPVLTAQQMTPEQSRRFLASAAVRAPDSVSTFFHTRRWSYELSTPDLAAEIVTNPIRWSSAIPITNRNRLISLEYSPRRTAIALLDAGLRTRPFYSAPRSYPDLLALIDTPDDPLISRLLDDADHEQLIGYVTGTWRTRNGATVLPDVADLPRVLSSLSLIDGPNRIYSSFDPSAVTKEYLYALTDQFPGVIPYLLNHRQAPLCQAINEHVYSRLIAATPDVEFILAQFEHLAQVSLDSLCATLSALSRSNSRFPVPSV